jgi:AcrR family transcriptional regulator
MSMTERLPLSRDRVVQAAVELADTYGVEALSMRKLGAALGVEAMSLYNHVDNKDDLIDGVLDAILGEIELPSEALPWDEQLRRIGHAFRRAGHDHPKIFPLFGSRSIRSISGFRPLERSYAVLRGAGLHTDDALDAFVSLASFVFGYVLTELGGLVDVAEGRSIDLTTVRADEHPWLVEMGAAFANRDGDRQFEFGLERMLRGLQAMVDATSN